MPTDFDNRRDVDLVIANVRGALELYKNLREGTFADVAQEVGLAVDGGVTCLAAGDVNKDGYTDFYVGQGGGAGLLASSDGRGRFHVTPAPAGAGRALAALFLDYDNDGLLDLLTVTSDGLRLQRALGGGEWGDVSAQAFAKLKGAFPAEVASADLDDDGALDLVFGDGRVLLSEGARPASLRVRLSARVSNAGGVGAKVEILAGSLRQKIETVAATPAPAPSVVDIGLGGRRRVDVGARALAGGYRPGGGRPPGADRTPSPARVVDVKELDRKPSSCPFLYAWNGARFEFITDFLGAGEMGYWEGPGHYSQPDPDEYVRIRDDQLAGAERPLRATGHERARGGPLPRSRAELLALAHPPGTEVYPYEGMIAPPGRPFALHLAARRPRAGAALDEIRARRHATASRALRSPLRRHLPAAPHPRLRRGTRACSSTSATCRRGPVLLLTGWTDYAFSSDNVAAHQAGLTLTPPRLEARGADGAWRPVDVEVGVPVGRPQTIALDLTRPSATRRARAAPDARTCASTGTRS